jgi:hypothetical protein
LLDIAFLPRFVLDKGHNTHEIVCVYCGVTFVTLPPPNLYRFAECNVGILVEAPSRRPSNAYSDPSTSKGSVLHRVENVSVEFRY